MKYIASLLKKITPFILVIFIFSVLGFGIYKLNTNSSLGREEVMGKSVSVFEKAMEPVYTKPERIVVESVGIDAVIEEVGIEEDGSLETPSVPLNAGWYKKGTMPGEIGNVLIDAHYDDNYGRPAAFYQLKNVKLDDKVTLVDAYGRRHEYKVVNYDLVGINDPNRIDVFKSDGSAKITLITCGGVWIPGKATYDKRLVIKGELIQ